MEGSCALHQVDEERILVRAQAVGKAGALSLPGQGLAGHS